jgi:hypothetical protein
MDRGALDMWTYAQGAKVDFKWWGPPIHNAAIK